MPEKEKKEFDAKIFDGKDYKLFAKPVNGYMLELSIAFSGDASDIEKRNFGPIQCTDCIDMIRKASMVVLNQETLANRVTTTQEMIIVALKAEYQLSIPLMQFTQGLQEAAKKYQEEQAKQANLHAVPKENK